MYVQRVWGVQAESFLLWEVIKKSFTYSKYVFAGLAQLPYLSYVACLGIHYFPTLSHKQNDFRRRKSPRI